MRSRARATAYFAHAVAFPCTKECWGESVCNAKNETALCNDRTCDAKPPESTPDIDENDTGECLDTSEYPLDPYIDADQSASDCSVDDSCGGEHVAICGHRRVLAQDFSKVLQEPSVRRTVFPVDEKAGRHVLAVPLESVNVQLSAEASKRQSIVDFDDVVWQKVSIGMDGGLSYELSPFLRELLLGISTEGGSARVGGSSLKAIRRLRQAEATSPDMPAEHSPTPSASSDGMQLVRAASVRQASQSNGTPGPALVANEHRLVFDMPVERVVVDPSGVAFLHAPSSWNISELMQASRAIDDVASGANCLHMCSPGSQCNAIVPLKTQKLWGNVQRPSSAEESTKTLTTAWGMPPACTLGEQGTTSIGFSAAAAAHWDAMVASNAQRPENATPFRLALTDGSPLSLGCKEGALTGIPTPQMPQMQALPTDVIRFDSLMGLGLASSSIPRLFCASMPKHEILRHPMGAAFLCSTDAKDAFAIVPYQNRVDSQAA